MKSIQEYYETPESAINAVKVGDAWGAIYFTDNFTDALVARMALGRDSDDETLDQSEMRVWLDMSSKLNFIHCYNHMLICVYLACVGVC